MGVGEGGVDEAGCRSTVDESGSGDAGELSVGDLLSDSDRNDEGIGGGGE